MESGIKLCERSLCTGCMSCRQSCAHNAIDITTIDDFDYPFINNQVCVQCGRCISACPIINKKKEGIKHKDSNICFAAWHKNDTIRKNSSSGGVFSAFCSYIFSKGGVVFGAAWDDMKLKHIGVQDDKDLRKIRRSKYVQSDTSVSYIEVKKSLSIGKTVLFSGTPCQIAGLYAFLNYKNYPDLFTIDVICQGVPSPHLFNQYIKEIEGKYKKNVIDVNFRNKKRGWRTSSKMLEVFFSKGKHRINKFLFLHNNSYYRAFYKEYFMRPSCYDCSFKNSTRGYYSDITIGDFWRIGNTIPFYDKDKEKGVSVILVNTEKGQCLFDNCKSIIEYRNRTWEEFATNGGIYCSKCPTTNNEARIFLKNHSWEQTQKKYFPLSIKETIKDLSMIILGEKYYNIIKQWKKRN